MPTKRSEMPTEALSCLADAKKREADAKAHPRAR